MEINENLARAELTPAQEAAHIKRRKELWVAKRGREAGKTCGRNSPTSLKDGRGTGPQHQRQFAAEIAAISRTPKSTVNLDLRRARSSPWRRRLRR
jgi:hypothetical protein